MRKPTVSTYRAWGIEIVDVDRPFIVGIGYSASLTGGVPADWSHVVKTLTFATREDARAALRSYRAMSAWAFTGKYIGQGGNRIFRSARVVPLTITVTSGGAA